MIFERYDAALDARAAAERKKAEEARRRWDEREKSLCLMRASMLGDMLKQLGRWEHRKIRPGLLQAEIDLMLRQAGEYGKKQDFDAANQAEVKAETIRWALDTLRALEAETDE